MSDSKWWYSVVRASPDPESGERVNIALVVGNGRLSRIEYDPGLPRLKCIADPGERKLISEVVRGIEYRLREFRDIPALRHQLGPQISVADPIELFQEPDRRILGVLRERYLGRERQRRSPRSRVDKDEMAMIDETLRPLISRWGFGLRVRKRASARRLFPEAADRIFDTSVPALDRAVQGAHKDLLIGGIRIGGAKDPLKAVRNSIFDHGRAFWHYKDARERIRDLTGRDVRTVGLIHDGTTADRDAVREAGEYIAHVWRQDADTVVHADDAAEMRRLEEEIKWVSGDAS